MKRVLFKHHTYVKNTAPKERNESERKEFERELAEITKETDIIYVDESGVVTEMNPIRARAKRGMRVYQATSGRHCKKVNVIGGYLNGIRNSYII